MSSALLDLALRNASLCGPFDPLALSDSLGLAAVDAPTRDAVLGALGRCSMERILTGPNGAPPRYCWMLHPDARRRVLQGLLSAQMIQAALATAPDPLPGDQLGPLLRAALRCQLPQDPKRSDEESSDVFLQRQINHWGAVYTALQCARDSPAADTPWIETHIDAAAIKIKALQRQRDIQIVLPSIRTDTASRPIPLLGRDHVKRKLSAHLRGLDDDPRPILMTSVDGAGKSALLASLLHGWTTRRGGPDVIVILDFDRHQLVTAEPIQMLQEVLRQLDTGLVQSDVIPQAQLPSVRDHLRRLRADIPNLLATGTPRDFGSQLGYLQSAVFPRLGDSAALPLGQLSIALIMDSFEAIDQQGAFAVRRLLDLEAALRTYGLSGLRTVVSDRAPPLPEPDLTQLFGQKDRRIQIGGLGRTSGGRLLKKHDTAGVFRTVAQRETASAALGGHPSALIVLGQYAATHKADAKALIKEISCENGFNAESAQTELYDRILQRIDDPELRAMAYPGLILRHLNADMIRLVLAKACFRTDISPDTSRQLRDRLGKEYWLTEPAGDLFPLRHRPRLRRLMLPGLLADRTEHDDADKAARDMSQAENARVLCNVAAEFFANGPAVADPAHRWWRAMSAIERNVESTYYRALGNTITPWFDRTFANHLCLVLGSDLDTLPPSWAARAKAVRGETLQDTDWDALPEDTRDAAADRAFQIKIRQEGFAHAGATFKPDPKTGIAPDSSVPDINSPPHPLRHVSPHAISRDIASFFLAADFAAVANLTPAYLDAMCGSSPGLPAGDDLFLSAEWYCVLAASVCSDGAPMAHPLPETTPEQGPYHSLVMALRAIQTRGALPADHPAQTGDALRTLLPDAAGWISADQAPLRTLRYHGADVMAGLTRPKTRQPQDIRLAARALALAVCPQTPSDLTSQTPELPGNLPTLVEPLYTTKSPADLALIQRLYRHSEPFHVSVRDVTGLSDPGRKMFTRMLRGLSPELYGPTRRVLTDLGAETAISCAEHLAATCAHWPRDLSFEKTSAYHDVQAATIVETSDQCGAFGALLDLLAPMDSRARHLAMMHARIGHWFFALHGPAVP
ncbi:hypothetical protein ACG74X_08870 [Marivita sp. S0852]|uniref:hypothetical protein n=1 Tax=Marivita sp. S0852 TaxID=3373893 RepID=UPI003982911B